MKSTAHAKMLTSLVVDVRKTKSSNANKSESRIGPKTNEKYSLRQRQKRSIAVTDATAFKCFPALAASMDETGLRFGEKSTSYGSDHSDKDYVPSPSSVASSRQKDAKAKTKAAPLSKYRRKTANARERTRMREINSAFENLRHCVPHTITGDESSPSNEKLTKITTLRLAMKYITVLTEALANPTFGADFLLECIKDGDDRFTTHNWTQPKLQPAEVDYEYDDDEDEEDDDLSMSEVIIRSQSKPVPPLSAVSAKQPRRAATTATISNSDAVASRKATTKRQRGKKNRNESIYPYSSSSSSCSSTSSSTSAYASMSSSAAEASPPSISSYLLESSTHGNTCQSMTDLSSLGVLESDGESLSCLSPLNHSFHSVGPAVSSSTYGCGDLTSYDTQSISQMPITSLENPLELSLRLFESSNADSLEFTADQQPSSCISPLITLDSFSPFADLLHPEFSEHSALDLFLT